MVECQEEGYQLQISNQGPGLSSAGWLAVIATRKSARGGKAGENSSKHTHARLNAGGSWRKIPSTSGKHLISIPQAGPSLEAVVPTPRAAGQGAGPAFPW